LSYNKHSLLLAQATKGYDGLTIKGRLKRRNSSPEDKL